MDFKISQDTYNPLLKRKEVHVEVDHDGQGTPSRVELRKAIAAKYNTKAENVYVVDVETKTGTQSAVCVIQVYDDPQTAQRIVPRYIQTRNLPPEERKRVREEEAKKEETKPKAEKPKVEKPKEESKESKAEAEKPTAEKPKEETKEVKPKQEAKSTPEPPKKGKEGEAK